MSRTPNPSSGRSPDAPHKPADDTEELYFQGSPVLRAELGRVLVFFLISAAVLVGVYFTWERVGWWLWLVGAVIVIALMSIPFIWTKMVRYRISNYRIDYERGLLSRRIDTLELWHVEDIDFYQSFFNRIVGTGTITVFSHDDTTPKLEMYGLPNPRPIFDALKQRVIAVKRQRGVIKVDGGGHDFAVDSSN